MTTNTQAISRLSNKICPEGMTIEEWQIALRRENAREANFTVEHLDDNRIWGDYLVSSGPGRYRTAFRGVYSDRNFCSCLDFRTNGLGTCKHLEAVTLFLQQTVPGYPWAGMTYTPSYTSVYVSYKGGRSIRMRIGSEFIEEYLKLYKRFFTDEGILPEEHYSKLTEIEQIGKTISTSFRMYDDVLEYAKSQLEVLHWRHDLLEVYPEERIPWDKHVLSDSHEALERMLYTSCYAGNGLFVAGNPSVMPHLIARLAEEIYQGVEHHRTGYIIVSGERELRQWQTTLAKYEELRRLPIQILTQPQFVAQINEDHQAATFAYIDNAIGMKNWQNTLSLAIKRLSIEHLYMHVDTLTTLTPVQLSSILQHISPFIIGPFYKFIHQNRPQFPLKDNGSNLPPEMQGFTYLCGDLPLITPTETVHTNTYAEVVQESTHLTQTKVHNLLSALYDVAQDPSALAELRELLKILPGRH